MAVLPDRRVLHTARNGDVRLVDPDSGVTKVVNTLAVYNNSEDGLQTVTLDPDFDDEQVGLPLLRAAHHDGAVRRRRPRPGRRRTACPPVRTRPTGTSGRATTSSAASSGTTPPTSSTSRPSRSSSRSRRSAASAATSPVTSTSTPTATSTSRPATTRRRARPGPTASRRTTTRPASTPASTRVAAPATRTTCAARSCASTSQADGSYTIPAGNLFAPGTAKTRPEIFVMGVRNPFRMDVDPMTNSVSWGDYGPDAGAPDAAARPDGLRRVADHGHHQADQRRLALLPRPERELQRVGLRDGDARSVVRLRRRRQEQLDVQHRPRDQVPPATAPHALLRRQQHAPAVARADRLRPAGGQGPMGGPIYHYDADNPSTTKFPAYWDSKAFFAEFSQDYLAVFDVQWPDGPVDHISDFLPNPRSRRTGSRSPTARSTSSSARTGRSTSSTTATASSGRTPTPASTGSTTSPATRRRRRDLGAPGQPQQRSARRSTSRRPGRTHPEGLALTYEWDFEGNGTFTDGASASYTYTQLGKYTARLRVTDPGTRGLTSTSISVGNVAPTVKIMHPRERLLLRLGRQVAFEVKVTDPEDDDRLHAGALDLRPGPRRPHAHPLFRAPAAPPTIQTQADATRTARPRTSSASSSSRTPTAARDRTGAAGRPPSTLLNPKNSRPSGPTRHRAARSSTTRRERPAQGHLVRRRRLAGLGPGEPRRRSRA